MTGMMKHKKACTFSQASMRQLIPPKPEDIFTSNEEHTLQERLARQAFEEAELRNKILNRKFTIGKKYFLIDKGNSKPQDNESHVFTYQGKQGKHHVFKHLLGGWITTRTDAQLIGKTIQEVH